MVLGVPILKDSKALSRVFRGLIKCGMVARITLFIHDIP